MKALRRDLAREGDLSERFIHEAKATATIKHPNVVQITDFGKLADDIPYFVMELLVGQTLGQIVKAGGPIPAGRAVRIIRQIAGALAAAHSAGIVHRDLKPDNVFLVGDARAVTWSAAPGPVASLAVVRRGADPIVDFGAEDRGWASSHEPASFSEPRTTCLRSRRVASPWITARTSTPWGSSCTRCSRAAYRSKRTRTWVF
jgi:serine/threonine protein kinase